MEHAEDDTPIQLHFDVSQAPHHMLAEDGPNQSITLIAAHSQAAAIENQADRFHQQKKQIVTLDYFAKLYRKNDKRAALQLLTRQKEIKLEGSQHVANTDDEDLSWQVHSHYLDMQICVGGGLGLAAMLPKVAIHHGVEFRLMLRQRHRRFSAKNAKLGFDPTNCMLWIGRSNAGEDTWLAWVPTECMGAMAEDVPPGSGKEETVMSQKHYRITVIFLAFMLREIGHRDITVGNEYPDVEDEDEFLFATNVL
jgi:hypothetical protein